MQLQSTSSVLIQPHCMVYGPSGCGKTRLIPTLTAPVIANTDFALGSIREHNIPFADCKTYKDFSDFWAWALGSAEAKQFKEIVVDDFFELCNLHLQMALRANKDGRQAYGQMADEMLGFIRNVKTINSHTIVLLCKEERIQDANKNLIYAPMVPGKAVQEILDYLLNQVYHMETWQEPTSGVVYDVLRTKRNSMVSAKDRSGRLAELEMAHLGNINAKVMS